MTSTSTQPAGELPQLKLPETNIGSLIAWLFLGAYALALVIVDVFNMKPLKEAHKEMGVSMSSWPVSLASILMLTSWMAFMGYCYFYRRKNGKWLPINTIYACIFALGGMYVSSYQMQPRLAIVNENKERILLLSDIQKFNLDANLSSEIAKTMKIARNPMECINIYKFFKNSPNSSADSDLQNKVVWACLHTANLRKTLPL